MFHSIRTQILVLLAGLLLAGLLTWFAIANRLFTRDRLAGFKRPKAIVFLAHDEMPRNATGKILHRVLRDMLARRSA